MSEALAQAIWLAVGAYGGVGALAACVFTSGLVRRIDPLAADAPWRVRLLLAPGMAALWPLMVIKALGRTGA